MTKLTITRGLPGSGKSTWAKKIVHNRGGEVVRINRDSLRLMLHDDLPWSKDREAVTVPVRDAAIGAALDAGADVICDDTNLPADVVNHLAWLAAKHGASFEVNEEFIDVPLRTCIVRDAGRHPDERVGEKVIRGMHEKFIAPTLVVEFDDSLPDCILVDIDGTLAQMIDRSPYEWHRVGEDAVKQHVARTVRALRKTGIGVVVCSGRSDICRDETFRWLVDAGIPFDALYMRKDKDMRSDRIVKREILMGDIVPNWHPLFVIDDRQQVVDMWRAAGLETWQVAEGNF